MNLFRYFLCTLLAYSVNARSLHGMEKMSVDDFCNQYLSSSQEDEGQADIASPEAPQNRILIKPRLHSPVKNTDYDHPSPSETILTKFSKLSVEDKKIFHSILKETSLATLFPHIIYPDLICSEQKLNLENLQPSLRKANLCAQQHPGQVSKMWNFWQNNTIGVGGVLSLYSANNKEIKNIIFNLIMAIMTIENYPLFSAGNDFKTAFNKAPKNQKKALKKIINDSGVYRFTQFFKDSQSTRPLSKNEAASLLFPSERKSFLAIWGNADNLGKTKNIQHLWNLFNFAIFGYEKRDIAINNDTLFIEIIQKLTDDYRGLLFPKISIKQ